MNTLFPLPQSKMHEQTRKQSVVVWCGRNTVFRQRRSSHVQKDAPDPHGHVFEMLERVWLWIRIHLTARITLKLCDRLHGLNVEKDLLGCSTV